MAEIVTIIYNVFLLILGFLIAKFNLTEILAGYDKNKVKDKKGLTRFVGHNLMFIGLLNIAIATTLKIAKFEGDSSILIYVVVTLILSVKIVLGTKKFEK